MGELSALNRSDIEVVPVIVIGVSVLAIRVRSVLAMLIGVRVCLPQRRCQRRAEQMAMSARPFARPGFR